MQSGYFLYDLAKLAQKKTGKRDYKIYITPPRQYLRPRELLENGRSGKPTPEEDREP